MAKADEIKLTKIDYIKYIQKLLAKHKGKLYVINPDDGNNPRDMYRYNGKFYVNDGGDWVRRELQEEYPSISKYMMEEIIYSIRCDKSYRIDREEFDNTPSLINFENCIYDINGRVRIPHKSQYLFTSVIPINYHPELEYKESIVEKFILDITESDKKKILLIQEMCGYCLFKKYNLQKAFLLVGEGANAKSTLLELLVRMLGKKNVSDASIEDISSSNRFIAYRLYGKSANISSEIGKKILNTTSLFKSLTGGDRITGERKFHHSFEFYNFAKLIFAINRVPTVLDNSEAFYRRWIPIQFSQVFIGKDCDVNILDKLTTPEQLSILLNWALEGLHRLLDNEEFSDTWNTEDVKNWWNIQTSSIYGWIMENYTINSKLETPKDEMYENYKEWCMEESYVVNATGGFTKEMKRLFGDKVKLKQHYKDGLRYWKGIGRKEELKAKSE